MCVVREVLHVGVHLGEGGDVEGAGLLLGGHVLLLLVVLLAVGLEVLVLRVAGHAGGAALLFGVVFGSRATRWTMEACWAVAWLAS